MKYYKKRIFILIFCLTGSMILQSCRTKTPWNPYLSAKERPSDKQRKEEQKQLKAGTKAYDKQIAENKKNIQRNIQKSTSPKKRYKQITKHRRRKKTKNKSWTF